MVFNKTSDLTINDVKRIVQAGADDLTDCGLWVKESLETSDRIAVVQPATDRTQVITLTGYTIDYLNCRFAKAMRAFPHHPTLRPVFECVLKAHYFTLMKCDRLGNMAHNMWSFDDHAAASMSSAQVSSPCS
jgi:hypothetical protein